LVVVVMDLVAVQGQQSQVPGVPEMHLYVLAGMEGAGADHVDRRCCSQYPED
jgi:hypothetical protein